MPITRQDFEGVLNFVHDLYDRRALEGFADRTMAALARIVSAERIVYGDFDVERQTARLAMQPAVVAAWPNVPRIWWITSSRTSPSDRGC